jgi:hypothetical protein
MLSRMSIFRISHSSLLALALGLLASPFASGQVAGGSRFTGELMRYLNLDPTKHLPELEKGTVVHNGVSSQERLADEVVAAGAMLLVRGKEASAVVDAFLHSDTFLVVHQVKRYQALRPDTGDGSAFLDLPLPDSTRIADRLKTPRRYLNLSVAEGDRLARLDPGAPDLAGRVRAVLAEIVGARLRAYAARGVAGVEPYVRENGRVVDPRVELRSAIDSLSFVSDAFPGFLEQLTARGPERRYYWMERSVERENVLVLSAELRNRGAASALGADIHFYASSQYNSMLTLIGVIPYADASLVFAVNHTFTDQVTGMGSSLRRSIARNLVASELARQLEETRKRLSR